MKLKWFNIAGLGIVLLGSMAGCSQPAPAQGDILKSDISRSTATASQADTSALAEGNNQFAFSLYQALKDEKGNIFYSPFSISLALAMTYAGARNDTATQMAGTMHYALPQDRLHPAFNSLDRELAGRGKGARGKDGKGFRLNIVNALWGQAGYKFLPAYLDLIAMNYGAGLRALDFKNETEGSRKTINKWVADQTEQRIQDLIPAGAIDPLTRLVLTNAIYFNAAWANQFQKGATQPGTFHLLDGKDVQAPMMNQTEGLNYFAGNGFEAVELPYDGRELSMLVLVPENGKFAAFEKGLTASQVDGIINGLQGKRVALSLPLFKFESKFSLAKALSDMGMRVAFTNEADFSGMTGNRDLAISDVIHQAFVAVDETGTEAAAATAVLMRATGMPASPIRVTVDRPFIFLIRDIKTGSVVFVGRVLNPAS
jgi:serpin B